MRKIIVSCVLTLLIIFPAVAQHSLIYTNPDLTFNQGKELFGQRKFAAAYRSFQNFLLSTTPTQSGDRQEAEFYLAASAFELRQGDASDLLSAYMAQHPYTPFFDKTNFMLGTLQFEKKNYKKALKYFEPIKDKHLAKRDKLDCLFNKGYCYVQLKEFAKAQSVFKDLKNEDSRYKLSAAYYYAYSEYSLGNYDAALPEFLNIETNPAYQDIVPYYIVQIYYIKKDYDKLNNRAEQLLQNNPNNKNNSEIYRIAGEMAYRKRDYKKAIDHLKNYEKLSSQVLRNDMYLIGLSYYQSNDFSQAVKYLSKCTTGSDEMAENAYLHLGNAYIRLKDFTNARLAYEAALRTKFNQSIREEALFNYALASLETHAAFGESIKAFDQLLKEFPESKYTDQTYDYLTTVYMTSKNYEAAYESIQKIKQPNAKLQETKQYILYQIGIEAFMQNNMVKACDYFTLSLVSSRSGKYSAECLYWRAESYFRRNKPDQSIYDLKTFFSNANAQTSDNYANAHYALGYCYFGRKNFQEAQNWFSKYVDLEENTKLNIYSDALNRLGDCCFNARDFGQAATYYNKAAAASPNTADYSLFQAAYVAGLQKNYSAKISKLEELINRYPKSEYTDDALYEMGRAYLLMDNDSKAIATYKRLLAKLPNANLTRKASLEIGMIQFNNKEYDQAIESFKDVITHYPGTDEAYTALESLETVYIEINDIKSYLAYTKTLGRTISNKTASREDSITYIASEKQYMAAKYDQAIGGFKTYLEKFCPGGRYCTSAQYYLADSYYQSGDKTNAMSAYQNLLKINGNQYTEEAVLRCAEITYDLKDYAQALTYFKQLQSIGQTAENKNAGRLGVLRCSFFMKDHNNTISVVNDIMADPAASEELKTEARYNRAKAYLETNQTLLAITDLKSIASDTRTANGAEAKYLLANCYFEQNKMGDAENEIMDFAKKNTPHQFWLARSFVLLADVYIKQNNDFQAKQYLLSLQKNYTAADEIQTLITERLEGIAQREKSTIIN